MSFVNLLAQIETYQSTGVETADTGAGLGAILIWLVFAAVIVVAMWKVFEKAGQAGWKAIVPIYNAYVLLQIVGRPGWWLLLYFIPLVNIVVTVLVAVDLAKSFGKSEVFGIIALWLFSFVGYLMLGFGDATYIGPGGNSSGTASAGASPTGPSLAGPQAQPAAQAPMQPQQTTPPAQGSAPAPQPAAPPAQQPPQQPAPQDQDRPTPPPGSTPPKVQ